MDALGRWLGTSLVMAGLVVATQLVSASLLAVLVALLAAGASVWCLAPRTVLTVRPELLAALAEQTIEPREHR